MKRAKQVLYLVVSLLVVVADQESKNYVVTNLKIGGEHTVIPGILSFTYLQNDGAAWSIFSGQMILFYLISTTAIAAVVYYLFNSKCKSWLSDTGLALVLGEVIGSSIDQLHLKYVINMLQLNFIQFSIFSIADSTITIGIVLVFIYLIFMSEKD